MTDSHKMDVVAVGSIALDTIETSVQKREDVLGGSASYACAAASFFGQVGMVGVVGDDFSEECVEVYRGFGIDLAGMQKVPGKTFRWSGVYEADMNVRRTISTDLNVFADFRPSLPESYRSCRFLFLANISPELQLHVLSEVDGPEFVVADTMDLWINTARRPLMDLIAKVDMLMVNDSEIRLLSGEHNIVRAAKAILDCGPQYVVVKKGEHGSVLFGRSITFMVPAYPLESWSDPTGAGDSFAGGFVGNLASVGRVDLPSVRKAMLYGSAVASCGVEAFGLDHLSSLTRSDIDERVSSLQEMMTL